MKENEKFSFFYGIIINVKCGWQISNATVLNATDIFCNIVCERGESMNISERLFNLRKNKKLSQEELANILGVSRQTISKWETGESTPDFDKIIPLCEFYGITSDELLSGKKDIIETKKEENRNNFARNMAIAIGLYIISVVFVVVADEIFNQEIIGIALFFIVNAIATSLIVYSSIKYKSEKEKEEKTENPIVSQVCGIIALVGVITYLIISFLTGAWHISWIIFIIMGLCCAIVKLIFSLKEENNNNKEGSDNNE